MIKKNNNNNNVVQKTDEKIDETRNALKSIKKNLPVGADVLYVTISHILENSETSVYETYGIFVIILLISLCIAMYQYLVISSQNKWYHNSIYSCDCKHCLNKKYISICTYKFFKHKIFGYKNSYSLHT